MTDETVTKPTEDNEEVSKIIASRVAKEKERQRELEAENEKLAQENQQIKERLAALESSKNEPASTPQPMPQNQYNQQPDSFQQATPVPQAQPQLDENKIAEMVQAHAQLEKQREMIARAISEDKEFAELVTNQKSAQMVDKYLPDFLSKYGEQGMPLVKNLLKDETDLYTFIGAYENGNQNVISSMVAKASKKPEADEPKPDTADSDLLDQGSSSGYSTSIYDRYKNINKK